MAATLIANAVAGASGGAATTAGITTTGATLIVAYICSSAGSAFSSISDSKGNTWTALQVAETANLKLGLYYTLPSSVGASHTFSSSSGVFAALAVQAWSGVSLLPLGNGMTGSGTTVQTGSLTPAGTALPALFISGFGSNVTSGTFTINSSFTTSNTLLSVPGNCFGVGMAYKSSSTAEAPTWTQSSGQCAAATVLFGVTGGGGGGAFTFLG